MGDGRKWGQSRIWSNKLLLAMRILSYPSEYLKDNPTLDRCAELVERLTEDKLSKGIFPYARRQATVRFAQPFTLSEIDLEKKMNRNEIMSAATMQCENVIQEMVDQINLSNECEGGKLF